MSINSALIILHTHNWHIAYLYGLPGWAPDPKKRAFNRPKKVPKEQAKKGGKGEEKIGSPDGSMGGNHSGDTTTTDDDVNMMDATQPLAMQAAMREDDDKDLADAFELAQLLFVVGLVAIKYIVFLDTECS